MVEQTLFRVFRSLPRVFVFLAFGMGSGLGCIHTPVTCPSHPLRCKTHEAAVSLALQSEQPLSTFTLQDWREVLGPVLAGRGLQEYSIPGSNSLHWATPPSRLSGTARKLRIYLPKGSSEVCIKMATGKAMDAVVGLIPEERLDFEMRFSHRDVKDAFDGEEIVCDGGALVVPPES